MIMTYTKVYEKSLNNIDKRTKVRAGIYLLTIETDNKLQTVEIRREDDAEYDTHGQWHIMNVWRDGQNASEYDNRKYRIADLNMSIEWLYSYKTLKEAIEAAREAYSKPIKHVVSVSSGAPSALLALKVIEKFGSENVQCLFADTMVEHDDNYRFLYDLQKRGMEIIFVSRGLTPEDLQRQHNTLYNQFLAPCTRILKLEPIRQHVSFLQNKGYDVHMHIGMTIEDAKDRRGGKNGRCEAPTKNWGTVGVTAKYLLVDEGYTRQQILDEMIARGYQLPVSYSQKFPNANCIKQGGCVKGGKRYMQQILEHYPDAYAKRETLENDIATQRLSVGKKTYTHLRDGKSESGRITLTDFRLEYEASQASPQQLEMFKLITDITDGTCGAECGVSSQENWV